MGEKGDVEEFYLRNPNVNWLTEYRARTITMFTYGLGLMVGKKKTQQRKNDIV